jgi:4-aminobutyrate aminotransferase
MAALVGKAELIDSMEPGKQIGTFIGHPPSSAAALETIRIIEHHKILSHVGRMGKTLVKELEKIQHQFPSIIKEVRGKGLLVGLEIETKEDEKSGKNFAMRCVEKGLYVGFYGIKQNVLRISPPLTIQKKQVDFIIKTIQEVAQEFFQEGASLELREKVKLFAIGLNMAGQEGEEPCL